MTTKKTAKKPRKPASKPKRPAKPKKPTSAATDTSGDNLSIRDENFVDNILEGLNITEAYHKANPNVTRESAAAMGHVLLKNLKIQDSIALKREILRSGKTLSRQRKREILADIAESTKEDVKTSDKTTAIKIDNQMTGDEAPIKHVGEITIGHVVKSLDDTTGLQR